MATWTISGTLKGVIPGGGSTELVGNTSDRRHMLGAKAVVVDANGITQTLVYCRAGEALVQYNACMAEITQNNPCLIHKYGTALSENIGQMPVAGVCAGGGVTDAYYFWLHVAPSYVAAKVAGGTGFNNIAGEGVIGYGPDNLGQCYPDSLGTYRWPAFAMLLTAYVSGSATINVVLVNTTL